MFTGYAETLSIGEALRETFDASKPCLLCRAISKAKESQQRQLPQQGERSDDKLVLALESAAPVFLVTPTGDWPEVRWVMFDPRVDPVPLPPPRT